MTQRIAIVGGGVSGLVVAHLLHPSFDITVFEASPQVGGHAHTVDVAVNGETWAVDTGFIVYNERNYPNFTKLLAELGVASQLSDMSFSVTQQIPDFEYNGSTVGQLFAQRRNLVNPRFYRMLWDIVRFNKEAPARVNRAGAEQMTLGALVTHSGYSKSFINNYLIPMGSAIWSTPANKVLEMDARFFVRFFENHGMLTINDRPQWRVIQGGSREYVRKLVHPFRNKLRTKHRVAQVQRESTQVLVDGEAFDQVVLACHSDQTLEILSDPTDLERGVLCAMPYQENEIVLHTDATVLPRRRSAWAAWNYHLGDDPSQPAAVTYNMNILQNLNAPRPLCVTLNDHSRIADDSVLYRARYAHPRFTTAAVKAQTRLRDISGHNRTHFCGAYWGNGFHEDGVNSAINVALALGVAA